MVQDHWPVGSEPQFVATLSYSWTQRHRGDSAVDRGWRRCPNRYGSGARALWSTDTSLSVARWVGNGKHGNNIALACEGLRSARSLARKSAGCDYEQQTGRPVGEPTGSNSGGGAAAVLTGWLLSCVKNKKKVGQEQEDLHAFTHIDATRAQSSSCIATFRPYVAGSQLVQHHAPWRNLTSKHLDAGASHMRCTRCKVQPGAPTTVMHQGAGAHRW